MRDTRRSTQTAPRRGRWLLLGAAAGALLLAASIGRAQGRLYYEWTAPPEFAARKNPFAGAPEALREGGAVYKKRCAVCHGPRGDGEGVSALSLSVPPGDFTDGRHMRHMTDGALFWKILVGRREMPPHQLVLKDEEIWKAVLYIRTFAR